MNSRSIFVAATAIIGLGFGAAASAVELVSPSLATVAPDSALDCRIVNLSGKDQIVTITSYNSLGAVVGNNTITVVSGGWGGVSMPNVNGPDAAYCKFSIPGGKKADDFRASINVLKFGYGIIASLSAY